MSRLGAESVSLFASPGFAMDAWLHMKLGRWEVGLLEVRLAECEFQSSLV